MKNHVLRPLFVALGVVVLILIARAVIVPADFGVGERGYMYGWHRTGNEADWKAVPIKYRGTVYCKECHEDKYRDIVDSPHGSIQCENCHGPALGHPKDPPTLPTDRKRELCLRCHFKLPYETSQRGSIKGVNSATHHPQEECVLCHYPHNPKRPPQQEVKR